MIRNQNDPCELCCRACKTLDGSLASTCKLLFAMVAVSPNASRLPRKSWWQLNTRCWRLRPRRAPRPSSKRHTQFLLCLRRSPTQSERALFRACRHPGGNATGFINIKSSVGGKWLQLLKDVMPQLTRATVLFNPAAAPHANYYRRTIETAATPLAITTSMAFVSDMAATEKEVLATAQDPSAGLIVGPDAFTFSHRYQIIELVNSAKVPAVYPLTPYATAGGLLSYGVDLTDLAPPCRDLYRSYSKGSKAR